jgi:hypothetical protein
MNLTIGEVKTNKFISSIPLGEHYTREIYGNVNEKEGICTV